MSSRISARAASTNGSSKHARGRKRAHSRRTGSAGSSLALWSTGRRSTFSQKLNGAGRLAGSSSSYVFRASGGGTAGACACRCSYPGASAAVRTRACRIGLPACVISTASDSARRPRLRTRTSSRTAAKAGELRKWQLQLAGCWIWATAPAARSAIVARQPPFGPQISQSRESSATNPPSCACTRVARSRSAPPGVIGSGASVVPVAPRVSCAGHDNSEGGPGR